MSSTSSIEWTDATWNPTRGCTKVSAGCKHCYAETFAERWRGVAGHAYERGFDLRLAPEQLALPLRWRKPKRVFVNSMSDLFHEDVPDQYIAAVFGVMASAPQHTFQVLTKRAERLPRWFRWIGGLRGPSGVAPCDPIAGCMIQAARYPDLVGPITDAWQRPTPPWPLPNVWIGVSTEDQSTADERVPHLLATPAAVRFISAEPLLGPIRLDQLHDDELGARWNPLGFKGHLADTFGNAMIHWVIVGGESGTKARPFDLAWPRSIVEQCRAAGTPVFVKQLGAQAELRREIEDVNGRPFVSRERLLLRSKKGGDPAEWPPDLRVREWPR